MTEWFIFCILHFSAHVAETQAQFGEAGQICRSTTRIKWLIKLSMHML